MHLPQFPHEFDLTILLLRLMVAAVFLTSGAKHLTHLEERSKAIKMPKPVTAVVGAAEVLGALGVGVGVLTEWAALGLIFIMLGAIYEKMLVWKMGFWGKDGYSGAHYDLVFLLMNFAIIATHGGEFTLLK